jgi:hypothetical protein
MVVSMKAVRLLRFAALMLFFMASMVLLAQRVTVRSYADPVSIGRDEETTYTIEINGEGGFRAPTPKLPELNDFYMRGMMTSSASNYSIINGKVSESVTKSFIYRLLPKRHGALSIPAFNISVNGKDYSTQKVDIRVLDVPRAGSQQGQGGSQSQRMPLYMMDPFGMDPGFEPVGDIEIAAKAEKSSVYVGEPLLVTYRLYTTQPVTSLELVDEKDFGGYGKEIYSEPSRLNFEQVRHKDQRYRSAVIKIVAISPNRSGEIELPRLTAKVHIGSIGLYSQVLDSQPLRINVRELPSAGRPANFSGAVGNLTVSDSQPKSLVRLGEALEYKLIISGRGNFNQFSNPDYPAQADFRIASPVADNQIQAGISGKRTITYLLIPRREGKFDLPGISFNWFDPASGTYKAFRASPRAVEVKPGNVLTYISNVFQRESIRTLSPFRPETAYKSQKQLLHNYLYWIIAGMMLLSLLPSWIYAQKKRISHADPELAALKNSARVLKKYLRQAEFSALNGSQDFYPQAEKGLMHYLADKYRISRRFSTREKIYQLRLKGLDENLIISLEEFLKRCQEARFMPGGFDKAVLSSDLEALKRVIRSFITQPVSLKKFLGQGL